MRRCDWWGNGISESLKVGGGGGMRRKRWVSLCLFSVEEGKSGIKFHQEPSP